MFTTSSSYHYLDQLDDLVNGNYNQSVHRSIKMKPADVNDNTAPEVWNNLYWNLFKKPTKYKFKVGFKSRSVSINTSLKKVTYHPGRRKPSLLLRVCLKEADGYWIQGTF